MDDDDERGDVLLQQRLAAGRVRLLRRVAARQRTRRLLVTATVVLIAGTGAVATLGADRAGGSAGAASVTCFTAPDLQAVRQVVALTAGDAGVTSADAERACGGVWGSGHGAAGGDRVLAAVCRLVDGSVGAFPVREADAGAHGDRLCDRLGLVPA